MKKILKSHALPLVGIIVLFAVVVGLASSLSVNSLSASALPEDTFNYVLNPFLVGKPGISSADNLISDNPDLLGWNFVIYTSSPRYTLLTSNNRNYASVIRSGDGDTGTRLKCPTKVPLSGAITFAIEVATSATSSFRIDLYNGNSIVGYHTFSNLSTDFAIYSFTSSFSNNRSVTDVSIYAVFDDFNIRRVGLFNSSTFPGWADDIAYQNGVNSLANRSFTTSQGNFFNDDGYPLFEQVRDNYFSIYGATTDEARIGLNVGYADMFPDVSFSSLRSLALGVSWTLAGCSVRGGTLQYLPQLNYFSSVSQYDAELNAIRFFLSPSSIVDADPYDASDLIIIEMGQSACSIWVQSFLSSAQNSSRVPNFNSGLNDHLYNITFSLYSSNNEAYQNGFDDGYARANSIVTDTSASYAAGYNQGLSSASNVSLDSVVGAAIDVPLKTVSGLLDYNVFQNADGTGGINLKAFLYSFLSVGLIIALVKLFIGR